MDDPWGNFTICMLLFRKKVMLRLCKSKSFKILFLTSLKSISINMPDFHVFWAKSLWKIIVGPITLVTYFYSVLRIKLKQNFVIEWNIRFLPRFFKKRDLAAGILLKYRLWETSGAISAKLPDFHLFSHKIQICLWPDLVPKKSWYKLNIPLNNKVLN